MSGSLPASRRSHILARVTEDGEAQVSALAQDLEVSPITVRRDIAALAAEGLLEQVRGGARRAGTALPASIAHPGAAPPVAADGGRPRIAMVVPSLRYYWPAIVHGATEAAQRLGVDLAVHVSTSDAEENLVVVEQIAEDPSVQALIIGPELRAQGASDRLVARLAELPVPVVIAERGIEDHGPVDRDFDQVRSDHSVGGAKAVRHLAGLGHRRIAYLGLPTTPTNPFIEAGYRRAVELLGLQDVAAPPRVLDPHAERPFGRIDEALERFAAEGTTAALVHSDVGAAMLLQHAMRSGWAVPEDLSLIAYDDELALTSRPAMTAVAPAKHALGERAVELALRRLRHPDAPFEHVMLLPSLQPRDTTKAPR